MRVVAIWSIKGGVGKTTTAVSIAALAAGEGYRTLLWDLDPQGGASYFLRCAPRVPDGARLVARRSTSLRTMILASDLPNLDLLPADLSHRTLERELDRRKRPQLRLALKLVALESLYDWIFLDCAPSVTLVSEAVLFAADVLLVPMVPSALSLRTLDQLREFAATLGLASVPVLPFLTMVDRRRRVHREGIDQVADGAGGFLRTVVPLASVVERAGEQRRPLPAAAPRSAATLAYRELWGELRRAVETRMK